MTTNKRNLTHLHAFLPVLLLMLINIFLLAGCSDTSNETQSEVAQRAISHQHSLKKQSPSEKRLSEDKELYADATLMTGQVRAISEATGESPTELALSYGAAFNKQHHISERRMEQIMRQGEKEGWHDNYDIGEGIEKMKLRDEGYKFKGDL